jgi:hypothetical protein
MHRTEPVTKTEKQNFRFCHFPTRKHEFGAVNSRFSVHVLTDSVRDALRPLRPLRRHQWARVRSNWVRQCPACRTGRQWFLGGTGIAHSSRGLWTGCSCRSRAVVLAVIALAVRRRHCPAPAPLFTRRGGLLLCTLQAAA